MPICVIKTMNPSLTQGNVLMQLLYHANQFNPLASQQGATLTANFKHLQLYFFRIFFLTNEAYYFYKQNYTVYISYVILPYNIWQLLFSYYNPPCKRSHFLSQIKIILYVYKVCII